MVNSEWERYRDRPKHRRDRVKLVVDITPELRAHFKGWCAKRNATMSQGLEAILKYAIEKELMLDFPRLPHRPRSAPRNRRP
jgi:hypothetical protein